MWDRRISTTLKPVSGQPGLLSDIGSEQNIQNKEIIKYKLTYKDKVHVMWLFTKFTVMDSPKSQTKLSLITLDLHT